MTRPAVARRPLARRLRVALFATGALSVTAAVVIFYSLWVQQTLSLRVTELERQVGVIGAGVAVGDILPGSAQDVGQGRARLLKVEAGLIDARLAVTDSSGTVLFSTGGALAAPSYPVSRLQRSGTEFDARSGVFDMTGVGRVAVVAVPVSFSAPGRPRRYLVAARPVADIRRAESWVMAAIAVAAAIALLVAFVSGPWLARRVTRPLVRLTDGVRAVAAGHWGRQVLVEGEDEVAALAGAFNEMSTRVADVRRAQQEFVGDVSHELRTPITSISGFADALADGTVTDPDGVRRAADIIRSEADRLADLTSTLLSLADLDSGAVEFGHEPVNTDAMADALRVRFEQRALGCGVVLRIDLGSSRPIADPERLLQALSAIVDNSLRHGTQVLVSAGAIGESWRVEVEDDGGGIAPGDRERVFGRFTRLDSSRATSSGGSGLGLAICRRIVEKMGGRVWADESPALGGARFTIELPAEGPDAAERTQQTPNTWPHSPNDILG